MKTLTIKLTGETMEDISNALRWISWDIVTGVESHSKTLAISGNNVHYSYEITDMANHNYDAKALRDAAYELGLSTYMLAAESGVPQPVVSSILLNERKASTDLLTKLCKALDLETSEIIQNKPEPAAA